ncbi:hypothetical protein AAGV33_02720 [Flavobacterium sp. FBOR7N2.3]|uniref:Uncharacterized protein n=1 Tax=Flavobacterium magnesitis TaxID=3138077 RepID=A0ABV4TH47_9FLAO
MNKFAIFKKSKKFYWSINKIYYCVLFSIIGFSYIFGKLLNLVDLTFLWLAVIVMIAGIFLKLKSLTEIEPLRGILEGELVFEKEFIIIDNKQYSLYEINSIKISNDDYIGKLINYTRGNVGPALSNGTNNYLVIFLKSKAPIKIFFELINSNDFQKTKPILIEYYIKKKIDFEELKYVLGEKSRSDIQELKEEIKKTQDSKTNLTTSVS